MDDIQFKKIGNQDLKLIETFLSVAGSSLNSFRYFNKRPLTVISNHIATVLLIKDNVPIGYGHLDKDSESVWLGVAISELMKGRGYGKMLIEYLLKIAKENKVNEVKLSVDRNNKDAIRLYGYFGFITTDNTNHNTQFMKLNLRYGE